MLFLIPTCFSCRVLDVGNTTITNNNANSQADINGTAHFVNANRGNIRLGLLSVPSFAPNIPDGPHSSTVVTFGPPDEPPQGGNFGRIDVLTGGTVSRLPVNAASGGILVFEGGILYDSTLRNEGNIHVRFGGYARLNVNLNHVITHGEAHIAENRGYLEAGEWRGEWDTPAIGTNEGMGSTVGNNFGVIRNFSAGLDVDTTTYTNPLAPPILSMTIGGIIENYGSINPHLPNVPSLVNIQAPDTDLRETLVRHHARHIDVSDIIAGTGTTIRFTVNGGGGTPGPWLTHFEHHGGVGWTPLGDTQILNFNPYLEDGAAFFLYDGWVIFNACFFDTPENTIYYIPEMSRLPIAGSTGTSGRWLQFEVVRPFMLQIGANSSQMMQLRFRSIYTHHLSRPVQYVTFSETNVLTRRDASEALSSASRALQDVTLYRTELGAKQNRLEFTINSLSLSSENLQDAESRVRNADMAREMMDFTLMNILFQASITMLAKANQLPYNVLDLLRG